MNILEIIVIVFVIGMAAFGFYRGFVKKLASILSLVLSVTLVSAGLPYVTEFLKTDTPLYSYILEQCETIVISQAASALAGTSSGDDASGDADSQDFSDILASLDVSSALTGQSLSLDRNTQMEIIDNLPVPEFLKDLLITYNNDEGYESLQADTFQEYVVRFIANAILNVISFVVSVILVQLLIWIIITALNIFSRIPVINGINHLAGLALGLIQALFFLWIFFLLLTMLQGTEIGQTLMNMVTQSERLSWLYESNLFLQVVFQTAALFQ